MVREYAAERLAEMPERARVEEAHAATFLALAEAAGPGLRGPGELEWLDRLEVEHQNIRAAIDWYAQHEPCDALRLAVAMSRFWGVRGHFTEGRRRLKALLGMSGDTTSARVKALNGAASLAIDQGDYRDARDLLGESIRLSQSWATGAARRWPWSTWAAAWSRADARPRQGPMWTVPCGCWKGWTIRPLSRPRCCTRVWRRISPASSRRPAPGTDARSTCAGRRLPVGGRALAAAARHIPPRAGRHPRGAQRA